MNVGLIISDAVVDVSLTSHSESQIPQTAYPAMVIILYRL